MKLLAVDGNSVMNRAFYGIRPLSTKDGLNTNGIYGFLAVLLRMQQETAPDLIVITFDMRVPTFRHKMYDGYKATRKGMPEELAEQMPVLKELLVHLGYRIAELEGYEADDLLGTFAEECRKNGDECVIATGDRDSFQLICESVTVRLASTKGGKAVAEIYDEAAIAEKYAGLSPSSLIDVKALMGDSSDNIPGVAGIGEKTALALISRFGSLDGVYENIDSPDIKSGARDKLLAGRESAYMSRELAVINCCAPIGISPRDCVKRPVDNAKAYSLMMRLEFTSLLSKFGVRPEKLHSDAAAQETGKVSEHSSLDIVFNALPDELFKSGETIDMLFDFSGKQIASFCVICADKLYLIDENAAECAVKVLSSGCKKRLNNLKLLHHFAGENGFTLKNVIFDAEIAGYILNPTSNDYSIPALAAQYGAQSIDIGNIFSAHKDLIDCSAVFPALADILSGMIKKLDMEKLFHDIELPLAEVLADMESAGFSVDADGLKEFGTRLDGQISRLQQEVYSDAGEEFNLNSPKQLGEILFSKLGLPTGKKTKTKTGYSTNADVLEPLAEEYPIVAKVLEYRSVAKLKSTYVDGLLKEIGDDGRIRTSFQQTLTRTGRISSTEPNLQNIPVRTEQGSELRRFFRAGEGNILLDADYSQIELRVLAHIAKDENMIKAFSEGEDIHLNTASQVFGMPPAFVTPLMRSRAKAVNFGIVYGIGAFSLSKDIGVSVRDAKEYIEGYLRTYEGVRAYMESVVAYATENGYVTTLFGRRRYLPELAAKDAPRREFGKRVAMNTPIQGSAADIIKIAMVRVHRRLKSEGMSARLILQVHDELIVESPLDEAERAAGILREEMEAAASLSVPMEAEVGRGVTWLDAK